MNKPLLAMLILSTSAVGFGSMRRFEHQARAVAERNQIEAIELTNRLAELNVTATEFRQEAKTRRTLLNRAFVSAPVSADLLRWLEQGADPRQLKQLSAELRERLGIAWDNSPDYVLVSKSALARMYLRGTDLQGRLTTNACAILAVSPEERAAVEATLLRAAERHAAWLSTNVLVRTAPSGDIVARYTIPANPALARKLIEEDNQAAVNALGPERSELFRNYAGMWFVAQGTLGLQDLTLEVQRDGNHGLVYEEIRERTTGANEEMVGSYRANVSPGTFPPLFKTFFPGGWSELAQREGFELPKEFERLKTTVDH
jgi:hypothetical protein